MHFENICVNVWREGESDMHECAHDVRVFGQSSYAFTQPVTPPLPPAHCLDNVKSTVNVLCSSGHQICVLAPLAILVMSQLILVPHGPQCPTLALAVTLHMNNYHIVILLLHNFVQTTQNGSSEFFICLLEVLCKFNYASSSFKACLHHAIV